MKFYVTTPIYYATAKPHLGSLYSTVVADVLAKIAKLDGKKTFFLTGTDEHGQKIATAAAKAGKDIKEFVDSFIPAYKHAWQLYHIDYDHFIRTTDVSHKENVQKLVRALLAKGDIYKGSYEGWYCVPCETFLTEKEAESATQDRKPLHALCNRETEWLKEESYFFRLSAYQQRLLTFYEQNPHFIMPKERAQEVISFVQAGLKDLSISRTSVKWGVAFPDDPEHVLYVWIEALCNYITGVGYGQDQVLFDTWWPADVQVMAKDIVRFHGVFWPALLMAANLQAPKQLLVHGWIKVNDQKMSKSLGNVVDPVELAQNYHPDCIRYFMIRYLSFNQDGEFNIQLLENSINADLANDLGNLLNRMIMLADKNGLKHIPMPTSWSPESEKLQKSADEMIEQFFNHADEFQLHLAYARLWQFVNQTNAYFHEQEPWKCAKTDQALFAQVMSATAHALYTIATLCLPVMPTKMEELFVQLGASRTERTKVSIDMPWNMTFHFNLQKPLFEKIQREQESTAPGPAEQKQENMPQKNQSDEAISIDLFAQIQLRAGTVIACEPVEKTDKLLKLTVSFGACGTRQIVSGIKQFYKPEGLVGQQFIFLYNLQPRTMVGLQSQGMILCAQDATAKPIPVRPVQHVEDGTILK
ncbi:methionine--tRNA ligase [bacterium]|nr:MAG: methionine--tRNA ligase [bacterium]QQR61574.1 MAG: methionine--tRNA ligase [bacterium]QQR62889.1 MAG: methionine--tRNA ligase [bacterium]